MTSLRRPPNLNGAEMSPNLGGSGAVFNDLTRFDVDKLASARLATGSGYGSYLFFYLRWTMTFTTR